MFYSACMLDGLFGFNCNNIFFIFEKPDTRMVEVFFGNGLLSSSHNIT